MFNALQGFDALHDGLRAGLSGGESIVSDYQRQRSHAATVDGYNALVRRYNEMLSIAEQLASQLQRERQQSARFRAELERLGG